MKEHQPDRRNEPATNTVSVLLQDGTREVRPLRVAVIADDGSVTIQDASHGSYSGYVDADGVMWTGQAGVDRYLADMKARQP